MTRRFVVLALAAVLVATAAAEPALAQAPGADTAAPPGPAVTFTGGASSITEVHGDWTISCRVEQTQKLCFLSQALSNRESGQRVFTIELRTMGADKVEGGMLLPFGLRLEAGVTLALDEKPFTDRKPFSTCMQQGCLAAFTAEGEQLAALRSGKVLTATAVNGTTGDPVAFAVSLAGFTSAMNRSLTLPRD